MGRGLDLIDGLQWNVLLPNGKAFFFLEVCCFFNPVIFQNIWKMWHWLWQNNWFVKLKLIIEIWWFHQSLTSFMWTLCSCIICLETLTCHNKWFFCWVIYKISAVFRVFIWCRRNAALSPPVKRRDYQSFSFDSCTQTEDLRIKTMY